MFQNLIESSSHKDDYARRSSFFLGAFAVYVLAFLAIGVGSIFAYSTRVENPDLRLVSLVTPIEPSEVDRPQRSSGSRQTSGGSSRPLVLKTQPVIATMDPSLIKTGTRVAPKGLELPPGTDFTIGIPSGNPFGGSNGGPGGGPGGDGTDGNSRHIEELGKDTPPPAMKIESKPPIRKVKISAGPLNGEAKYLPKPPYSQLARIARADGVVTVEVLIDEYGKVVSARVLSGHPLLRSDSIRAAYNARFSPTTLGGQPVKVSGVITYNFVLQ